MNDPIDLNNFRDIVGDDKQLEDELITLFFQVSSVSLEGLEKALNDNDNKLWREHAHAWKGSSVNLGAALLGKLCETAQKNYESENEIKADLLRQMKKEFDAVKKHLQNL